MEPATASEFTLPVHIAIGATFFFAITGALAGIKRGYDIIGVFVMAFITGLGGALIRDGVFIQDGPPALTRDWRYIGAVAAGCVIGWLLGKLIERYQRILAVIDAIGLAAFSVVGVQISLTKGLSIPAAILVGVINACGGGLLRDIIVRDEPLMMKPGQLYVLASAIGSALFVWLTIHSDLGSLHAGFTAIGITLIIRLLSIRFNWHTAPVRGWRDPLVRLGTPETPEPQPPALPDTPKTNGGKTQPP